MPIQPLPDWIFPGDGPLPKVGDVFVVEQLIDYPRTPYRERARHVVLRRFRPEAYDDRQLRLITED